MVYLWGLLKIEGVVVMVFFFIFISLFFIFFILPTIWLKIENLDHSMGVNKKILQISDLHVEKLRISPNKLKRVIESNKPDYIFLTGDYLREEKSFKLLSEYLEVIRDSQIPTYAVFGNHDHYLPKVLLLKEFIEGFGIVVLVNESIEMDGFTLIGIDDYGTGVDDEKIAFNRVKPSDKKIVLSHEPNIVLVMSNKFDLLLSGHFHGKQINIPYLFTILPRGDLPKQGIYKGLHKSPLGNFYISKGLGQTGWNMRFLVRSEVTIHKV
jgi:uncharacterized protein